MVIVLVVVQLLLLLLSHNDHRNSHLKLLLLPLSYDFDRIDNRYLICFHCGERGHKVYPVGDCKAHLAGRPQNAAGRKVHSDYQLKWERTHPTDLLHFHLILSSSSSSSYLRAATSGSNSAAGVVANNNNKSSKSNAPIAVDDFTHEVFVPPHYRL